MGCRSFSSLFLLILSFPFLMGTCSSGKEVQSEKKGNGEDQKKGSALPEGPWRLLSIRIGKDSVRKPKKKSTLRFPSDSTFSLKLKVNECQGGVEKPGSDRLHFKNPICTEMCCDTDLQRQMVRSLSDLESYSLKKERLILRGEGVEIRWEPAGTVEH